MIVILTAPTGKAAFNINGNTLHSTFYLPITQQLREFKLLNGDTVNTLFTTYRNVKLVIIDEFSMMGSKIFHYVNFRMQQIFKSNEFFGGISVIMFGDFKQLPPVGDSWLFKQNSIDIYSVLTGNALWNQFSFYELKEIMRQKDDKIYATALGNLGNGALTENEILLFKSREVELEDVPEEIIHLFTTNEAVDDFNNFKIRCNANKGYTSLTN